MLQELRQRKCQNLKKENKIRHCQEKREVNKSKSYSLKKRNWKGETKRMRKYKDDQEKGNEENGSVRKDSPNLKQLLMKTLEVCLYNIEQIWLKII